MTIVADLNMSIEPAWPWSLPNVGMPVMIATAGALALLTIWTYLGARRATWRRILAVVSLRLGALMLAFCMVLRPSLATVHLEGVETTKLIALFDRSSSMTVADVPGKSTRWQQVNELWQSRPVQRRLELLAAEQKIEVVKYLAAEDVRPDDPGATADGRRTDIGLWLHQLWQKHGHEKRLRGILVFSDGGDNGTQFSALQEARTWRGIAPIHAFGAGSPDNAKLNKDIALTNLTVIEPTPVTVKSTMKIKALVQATGFKDTEAELKIKLEEAGAKEPKVIITDVKKILITGAKNQDIRVSYPAPDVPGEYKLTLKVVPHPDETNKDNNEISTIVQVIKEKITVLWVDRPRYYEPTFAIRALKTEPRFDVYYANPPPASKDPIQAYELDKRPYDVIVIGDISAQQFCAGKPEIFDRIKDMVVNAKTGLLLLGGIEAFGNGGWGSFKAIADLAPATFVKKDFSEAPIAIAPTSEGSKYPFLPSSVDPKDKGEPWKSRFDPLQGLAPLGEVNAGDLVLATGKKGELALVAGRRGAGRVVLFAGDSTWRSWLRSKEAVPAYVRFWKQLVYWLAQEDDRANLLTIDLPRRRVPTSEPFSFTFRLRGKSGALLPNAQFKAEVIGPQEQRFPVAFQRNDQQHQQGTFPGAKDPGEYQIVISGSAKDTDGSEVKDTAKARFLVEYEDVEMARPAADHELLSKIAAASDGKFRLADEQGLLQYLDEVKNQVNGESRQKTTHWPDWKRLPPSDGLRDQLTGMWQSCALAGFVLFVLLLGTEWSLRRLWGMV